MRTSVLYEGWRSARGRVGTTGDDRVDVDRGCYACMVGGPDRRTLFLLTSRTSSPAQAPVERSGRVEMIDVAVGGAGLP